MFAEFSCVEMEMEKSKCTIFQLLDLYFAWLNGYFFVKHATVYFAHVNSDSDSVTRKNLPLLLRINVQMTNENFETERVSFLIYRFNLYFLLVFTAITVYDLF